MEQKVENELFLVRETSSGAILNTDRSSYDAIIANKRQKKSVEDSLRAEIQELRDMILTLTRDK